MRLDLASHALLDTVQGILPVARTRLYLKALNSIQEQAVPKSVSFKYHTIFFGTTNSIIDINWYVNMAFMHKSGGFS